MSRRKCCCGPAPCPCGFCNGTAPGNLLVTFAGIIDTIPANPFVAGNCCLLNTGIVAECMPLEGSVPTYPSPAYDVLLPYENQSCCWWQGYFVIDLGNSIGGVNINVRIAKGTDGTYAIMADYGVSAPDGVFYAIYDSEPACSVLDGLTLSSVVNPVGYYCTCSGATATITIPLAAGKRTDPIERAESEQAPLIKICHACEHFNAKTLRCERCGCPHADSRNWLFNRFKRGHCPIGKW